MNVKNMFLTWPMLKTLVKTHTDVSWLCDIVWSKSTQFHRIYCYTNTFPSSTPMSILLNIFILNCTQLSAALIKLLTSKLSISDNKLCKISLTSVSKNDIAYCKHWYIANSNYFKPSTISNCYFIRFPLWIIHLSHINILRRWSTCQSHAVTGVGNVWNGDWSWTFWRDR